MIRGEPGVRKPKILIFCCFQNTFVVVIKALNVSSVLLANFYAHKCCITNYYKFSSLNQYLFILLWLCWPGHKFSQSKNQNISQVDLLSGDSREESMSKPIEVVGRNQP